MKKWIACILCFVLCVSLFSGCSFGQKETKGEYSQTLSDELRAEISSFYGRPISQDERNVAGFTYLGTYNGYVVLLSVGGGQVPSGEMIGPYEFSWPSAMALVAYKDNTEFTLKKIYEDGKISDTDLDQIYENWVSFLVEYNQR